MKIYEQTDQKLVLGDSTGLINILQAYGTIVVFFGIGYHFFYFPLSNFNSLPWEELYRPGAYLLGIPLLILVLQIFLLRTVGNKNLELTKKMELDKQTGLLTMTTRTPKGKNQLIFPLAELKGMTFSLVLNTVSHWSSSGIGKSRRSKVKYETDIVPRLQFDLKNKKNIQFDSNPSLRRENEPEYLEYEDFDWEESPLQLVAQSVSKFLNIPIQYPKEKGKASWPPNTEKF